MRQHILDKAHCEFAESLEYIPGFRSILLVASSGCGDEQLIKIEKWRAFVLNDFVMFGFEFCNKFKYFGTSYYWRTKVLFLDTKKFGS